MNRFRSLVTQVGKRAVQASTSKPQFVVPIYKRHSSMVPLAAVLFHKNNTPITCNHGTIVRSFATMTEKEINKRLDDFQDLFVEARLCIEDCQDSAGTTYYEEDADAARQAVQEAVQAFDDLIADVDDDAEKNRILRGNGLKVEQLKGELEVALHAGHDHH